MSSRHSSGIRIILYETSNAIALISRNYFYINVRVFDETNDDPDVENVRQEKFLRLS